MPLWTIISDDLTGLQAIAGEFARLGFRVGTGTSRVPSARELQQFEIFGFDTATRSLPAAEAESRVRQVVRQLVAAGAGRIFKHNDSILQGHVAAELRAVADTLGAAERPIVYAPACPNRRRVTKGAVQFEVDAQGAVVPGGLRKPLRDMIEQDTGLSTSVMDLPRLHQGEALSLLASACGDVLVADAVTDADLDRIAALSLQAGCRVLSGSVGLAAALARAALPTRGQARPVLVLAGSLQAATRIQVEQLLARSDCAGFALPGGHAAAAQLAPLVQGLRGSLAAGRHCVVWTPPESVEAPASGGYPLLQAAALERLRESLRAVVRGVIADPSPALGGLVAAGGMTADLVLREVLGITQFTELDWLCEGMTIATAADGAHPGLAVVTKSGGWGADGALCDAVNRCAPRTTAWPAATLSPHPASLESLA